MNKEIDELLTLKEAARILKTSEQSLRRWDKQGILKAVRVGNRRGIGDRRYRKQDIEAYISRKNNTVLPEN
ncbi:MAG: helix-turn-helix domain-containing protein [Candidatus Kuenenia stuttgartiensis]|nr:helix-turn-helix domain-containing protein [Candidatus Kuenenia stuttgartiensis]